MTNQIKLTDKFDNNFRKNNIKSPKLDYVKLFNKLRLSVGHKFFKSDAPKLSPELSERLSKFKNGQDKVKTFSEQNQNIKINDISSADSDSAIAVASLVTKRNPVKLTSSTSYIPNTQHIR